MSLKTINRDLNSTGKKFFIDNYLEVKEFWQNKISKDELIRLIKTKEDWQNKSDNSIQNKISSIKSFFDKEWNIDALKITIASKLKTRVLNKAKELFELELGRKFDENNDQVEQVVDNNLIPEILVELNNEIIQKLCLLEIFNLQKGTNKLIEFENYNDLTKDKIISLLDRFKESNTTFTKFIDTLNKNCKLNNSA